MSGVSVRRVRAIVGKELREYTRNYSIVAAMTIIPLIFLLQPVVIVLKLPPSAAGVFAHTHVLLYLLAVPALAPATVAAYAVVGERLQGTLEPILTTPIRRQEFLLGKALAALMPSVAVAYAVYAAFLAVVGLFAERAVTSALLHWPDLVAQVLFTPLLALWSIWIGIGISARVRDVRVAQQLGLLAGLPAAAVTSLVAFGTIPATAGLAFACAAVLLLLDGLGWPILSATLDPERLITGGR
jgi:ABC-2 type transport system permease protein